MKNPRNEPKQVDLTTLLDPKALISDDPEDCFGELWDPQDKDCAICHDVEICGIVKQEDTKKKVKAIEKREGPMLDQTAFEKVPIEKIVQNIKEWAADGDPATYEELADQISKSAQTKDSVAVREYIKRILPRHGLVMTPEKTIVPNESTDHHLASGQPITPESAVPGSEV